MAKTLVGDRMAGFKFPINLRSLASGATNTTQEFANYVVQHDMKLAAAYATLIASLTGAATDYANFNIVNKGTAGTGTTIMASLAFTSGITATLEIPKAFTLSTTAANLLLSSGEIVAVAAKGGGAGAVYPIAHFVAHFTMQ